jgi:putative restriction endonuclease
LHHFHAEGQNLSTDERKPWTRDELILAINLYCKTPFGRIHVRNPDIIELAKVLDRTPGSVSYKLANFANIDPTLERKGASHISKLDVEVWNDFFENWDEMAFESEKKSAEIKGEKIDLSEDKLFPEGKTKESVVKTRVNQNFFRKMILSSYNQTCCITGLAIPELLVASHIKPWSLDTQSRMNPRNGLCLNALHDKAFDSGLITIDEDFHIMVSKRVVKIGNKKAKLISDYAGKKVQLPNRFIPDQEFLAFHRKNVFIR